MSLGMDVAAMESMLLIEEKVALTRKLALTNMGHISPSVSIIITFEVAVLCFS